MDSELKFKVFRRGDDRRAFRLESIFWNILEEVAKSQRKSLRDTVFSITESSGKAGNQSSLLRSFAASYLAERLSEIEGGEGQRLALAPFYASPAPGLVVSESRRIVAHNKAMLDFINAKRSHTDEGSLSDVRFVFDVPISQILTILSESPNRFMECGFKLTIGKDIITGRARLWPISDPLIAERQVGAFIL